MMDQGGAFAEGVLHEGLMMAKAWEMLHNPAIVCDFDTDTYHKLCLDAGYSKTEADKAAQAWGFKRLEKDLPV